MTKQHSRLCTGLVVLGLVAGIVIFSNRESGSTNNVKLVPVSPNGGIGQQYPATTRGKSPLPGGDIPAKQSELPAVLEKKLADVAMTALKDWEKREAREVKSLRGSSAEINSMFMLVPPVTAEYRKEVMDRLVKEGIPEDHASNHLAKLLEYSNAASNYRWIDFDIHINNPDADSITIFSSPNKEAVTIDPITDEISFHTDGAVVLDSKQAKERYSHLYQLTEEDESNSR